MSCGHSPPVFGCDPCITARGKIYNTNLDYQVDKLNGIYNELGGWYDKPGLTEKVLVRLDKVLDTLVEVIMEIANEASPDTAQKFLGFRSSSLVQYSNAGSGYIEPSKSRKLGRKGKARRSGNSKRG